MNCEKIYRVMYIMLIMLVISLIFVVIWYFDNTKQMAGINPYAEEAIETMSRTEKKVVTKAYSLEVFDDRIEWVLYQSGPLIERTTIYYVENGIVTSNHFIWIFKDKHEAKYRYSWVKGIANNVEINGNILEGELIERNQELIGKTIEEAVILLRQNSDRFAEIQK